MKKLIAYREIDSENDVWRETAFLFKSRDDVRKFFDPQNPDFTSMYTDEEEEIKDFEISDGNPAGHITEISFSTDYAAKVIIREMSEAYLITS